MDVDVVFVFYLLLILSIFGTMIACTFIAYIRSYAAKPFVANVDFFVEALNVFYKLSKRENSVSFRIYAMWRYFFRY